MSIEIWVICSNLWFVPEILINLTLNRQEVINNTGVMVRSVLFNSLPKGDLWVQSPMIIVCQSPKIAGDLPKRIVGLCPLGRA